MFFVNKDGFAHGKTLAEIRERTEKRMTINRVQRADGLFVAKLPSLVMQEGDRLMVSDTRENLKEFERLLGVSMTDAGEGDDVPGGDLPVSGADQQIAEVVLIEGSRLAGRTLSGIRFADRYGMITLAIHRAGRHPEKLYD